MATTWNWLVSRITSDSVRGKRVKSTPLKARNRFQPNFLTLESRTTPTVNVTSGFEGIRQGDVGTGGSPPDTDMAVGPSAIMETVNSAARLTNKSGTQLDYADLTVLFPPATANAITFDPISMYDDNSQRFYLMVLEQDDVALTSFLHIAVSNTSTPMNFTTDFTEKVTIDLVQVSPTGQLLWGDYPRAGYNADGIFVTLNMFDFANVTGYNNTAVIAIQTSTLTDANPATLRFFPSNRPAQDFTMVPARMHAAPANSAMMFINTNGFGPLPVTNTTNLRFTSMTNYFSAAPNYTTRLVAVPAYFNGNTPDAIQPFTAVTPNNLTTNDSSILSAAWRSGKLVAAGATAVGGFTKVRWYEFDAPINTIAPTVVNRGNIDPGVDVSTWMPSIEISANLDIGMTYMQTSPRENLSVYVTGRTQADTKNAMQTPARARLGDTVMLPNGDRTGDYSGIGVDPLNPNTFYFANEYATSAVAPPSNWATWIGSFTVATALPNPIKALNPLRWAYDRASDSYSGAMTIVNTGPTITGTLTLQLRMPDTSVTVVTPVGTRNGNIVSIPITGPFVTNVPQKIGIQIRDPNRIALGSTQLGLILGIY